MKYIIYYSDFTGNTSGWIHTQDVTKFSTIGQIINATEFIKEDAEIYIKYHKENLTIVLSPYNNLRIG